MSALSYNDMSKRPGVDPTAYVRRSAGSAAIAAVLMCLYGFGMLDAPTPEDLFGWCKLIFYHTLRIGGIAYAIVAIWCFVGRPAALIADGILSVLVGALFMLTGIGMLIDGGGMVNSVLITVFGWLFAGSGLRDFKVYRFLTSAGMANMTEPALAESAGSMVAPDLIPRDSATTRHGTIERDETVDVPVQAAESDPTLDDDSEEAASPSGDGFLADLAKEGGPPRV